MSYKYVPELNPQKPKNNNNKSSSTLGLSFFAVAWGDPLQGADRRRLATVEFGGRVRRRGEIASRDLHSS